MVPGKGQWAWFIIGDASYEEGPGLKRFLGGRGIRPFVPQGKAVLNFIQISSMNVEFVNIVVFKCRS